MEQNKERSEQSEQNHWQVIHNNRQVVSNTPESLWINAMAYFKWCDENPVKLNRPVMSGKAAGTEMQTSRKRAYTVKALCLHCNISEDYLRDLRESKDKSNGYFIVVEKILGVIWSQNLENAMVDEFNPGMTARLLNMEKEDAGTKAITVNVVNENIPELAKSENEVLEKLNREIQDAEIIESEKSQKVNLDTQEE